MMQDNAVSLNNRCWKVSFDIVSGLFSAARREPPLPRISAALVNAGYRDQQGNKRTAGFAGGRTACSDAPLSDMHGTGKQYKFTCTGRPDGLDLTYLINIYDNRPFILLRLAVANRSKGNIYLHDLNLLQARATNRASIDFPNKNVPLDFFKVGWHDWVYSGLRYGNQHDVDSIPIMKPFTSKMLFDPAVPVGRRKGEFWGEGWGILTDQQTAILAGFVSTADQFGTLHVNCKAGAAELTLTAPADGILLEPGEEFNSEWGFLQFIDLPSNDPAADYVAAVAKQMKPRVPVTPPPAQWTHWYHFFQSITADLFIQNLNAIDNIGETIPFKIVQLDDGYQSAWGDWTICNAKFPEGLAHLSKAIKAKGYTSGLWLAPFVVDPRSKLAHQHPEWMVKERNGKPLISGFFYEFWGYVLDLTQPEVQEHVRSLLHTIASEWGYGFVKTDFVYSGGLPGVRQNPKMTRAQAFRKGMEAVRQGIGEETFLLGCGCPFGPAIGLVDAIRIGPDTAPNWAPYLWNFKWATPIIKGEMSIAALRNNVRHTLNLSTIHRSWWWNDPDCLMVRNYDTTLTDDEIMSNVSLIGLSGGLMINSDDLTRLPVERQKWVSLLTPVLSEGGRPLDLLEREMAELYDMPVNRDWGNWHDTALFNWNERTANRLLNPALLGFAAGQKLHIFDFWHKKHWLTGGGDILLEDVRPHGCCLLRICAALGQPLLIGDTLHITQGLEIEGWQASGTTLQIRTADLGRKVEGSIWLSLPGRVTQATCNSVTVNCSSENDGIYRLDLKFKGKAEINIQWEQEG
jgi:alpha-galactosidase